MERLVTTPFGQRTVTAGLLKSVAKAAEAPALPHVDKWKLLRELCAGRCAFGLTDRELGVLEGLLSFHPGQILGGNTEMIVFPSNRALAERCHGMAESTLRRHLARIVGSGLVLRHDSPNGKRYASKNGEGEVLRAFGFDLSPLLVRAPEIMQAAQAARDATLRIKTLRETISLQKRDAQKIAAYALEEGLIGDWDAVLAELLCATRMLRRRLSVEELDEIGGAVETLLDRVHKMLHKADIMSGNGVSSEQHYQNSNTDSSVLEHCLEKSMAADVPRSDLVSNSAETETNEAVEQNSSDNEKTKLDLPLPIVLKAIPQALEYASSPARSPHDLARLGSFLRGMIGVSPSAWDDAVEAMGPVIAGITICCLVERIQDIRSPGGYLRHLTRETLAGRFSITRLIMAQLQRPETGKV